MTVTVPPSRLLGLIGLAFVAATVVAVFVVLPAEYGLDLTGFGRLTGITRLAAPPEIVVETRSDAPVEIERIWPAPFRTDTVTLNIPAGLAEVEFKVTADPGETILYSWSAPKEVTYDFHGHADNAATGQVKVMNYRSGQADAMSGTLVPPIAGIHGWYFRSSGTEPFTITIHLSGYYDLRPGRLEVRNPLLFGG